MINTTGIKYNAYFPVKWRFGSDPDDGAGGEAVQDAGTIYMTIRGAYMKGRKARLEGKTLAECPYYDLRKPSGKLSWSRSFINSWRDGFRDMDRIASNDILRS